MGGLSLTYSMTLGLGPQQSAATPGIATLVTLAADGAYTGGDENAAVSGNSLFLPFNSNDGTQYVAEVDLLTGSVIQTVEISDAYVPLEDDHLDPCTHITPTGALLIVYAGHSTDAILRFRRSAAGTLAGLGTEYTKTISTGNTTYPKIFTHTSTGKLYCIYRTGAFNLEWAIMESADDGLTWTVLDSFVNHATNQMYVKACWVPGTDRLRLFASQNRTISDAIVYVAELDVVTGAVTSGSGTICNVRTDSPAAPQSFTTWSTLYSPGAGFSAMNEAQPITPDFILLSRATNDQQSLDYYVAKLTGANPFTTADWTVTYVCSAGQGVGDTDTPANRWFGMHVQSWEPGLTYPRLFLSRNVGGVFYLERWDALNANGTSWRCTYYFGSKARGTSDAIMRPSTFAGATSRFPFYYLDGTYHSFTDWNLAIKGAVTNASNPGTPPTITSSSAISAPELSAYTHTLTANRQVGWAIVGGADAAQFSVVGDKLTLASQSYATPADADANNTYLVQVRATDLAGNYAEQTITVTVTDVAWTESAWGALTEYWDFDDAATVFEDTGGTNPAEVDLDTILRINGKKGLANLTESTSPPDYITDAGTGKKVARFVLTDDSNRGNRLVTTNATLLNVATGGDNGWVAVFALKRGDVASSRTFAAWHRKTTQTDFHRMSISTNAFTVRQVNGAGFSSDTTAGITGSDAWYIVTFVYSGTAMRTWINGVERTNLTTQDTASITFTEFALGSYFQQNPANNYTAPFGGYIGYVALADQTTRDANVIECENMLGARYGVTMP